MTTKKKGKTATGPDSFLDLAVEYVDPRTLTGDPRNPRRISPEARAALRASLGRYGIVQPFLIRAEDGEMIGGHQRLAIAVEEGYRRVPIVRLKGLTKAEARALGIVLNNPRAQGTFAEEDLRIMLGELNDEDLLNVTGFDVADLQALEHDAPQITEHPAPVAPRLAWWLISVPIESAIEVGDLIERLSQVPNVNLYATVSSDRPRMK